TTLLKRTHGRALFTLVDNGKASVLLLQKARKAFFAKAVHECNSNHPYVLIFTGHQLSKTGKDAFY
ncbi:hypothetical protein ABC891_22970, partial [Bacillus licheniformis]